MCFPEVISLCMKNWFQHFFCISVFYEWQALQFLFLLKSFQNFPYNIFMYTSHVVLHLFWLCTMPMIQTSFGKRDTDTIFSNVDFAFYYYFQDSSYGQLSTLSCSVCVCYFRNSQCFFTDFLCVFSSVKYYFFRSVLLSLYFLVNFLH